MWGAAGCIGMFLAVAFGAFAAHGLKGRLSPEMLTVFETGVRYQAYHALALLVVDRFGSAPAAGWAFVIGIIVFSGSLYLLALTGTRWLGAITPIGGLSFLVGWILLLTSTLRRVSP